MAKRKQQNLEDEPEVGVWIDPAYEQRVEGLKGMKGRVTDYADYASDQPDMRNHSNLPYVPARQTQEPIRLSADGSPMPIVQAQPVNLPGLPQSTRSGHVRHVEDPISLHKAILLMGHTIGFWVTLAISALLFYGYMDDRFEGRTFLVAEVGVLAISMIVGLLWNQRTGLHHSATGIAHHEIKATREMNRDNNDLEKHRIDKQAEVATHAIDKHVEMLEKKWLIEQQMNQKRLPGE